MAVRTNFGDAVTSWKQFSEVSCRICLCALYALMSGTHTVLVPERRPRDHVVASSAPGEMEEGTRGDGRRGRKTGREKRDIAKERGREEESGRARCQNRLDLPQRFRRSTLSPPPILFPLPSPLDPARLDSQPSTLDS
eukprot:328310-Rhodomonas_salina.1